nr:MAG TPA: hypothetical protein [Caudoviricetes sp.]
MPSFFCLIYRIYVRCLPGVDECIYFKNRYHNEKS